MNTELLGVIAQIVLMVVLAYPIGKYISKVFKGEKVWSDFMTPIEKSCTNWEVSIQQKR